MPILKPACFALLMFLPGLSDDRQFLSLFNEYFKDQDLGFVASGLGKIAPSLMVKNIKRQISQVAQIFIAGSRTEEILKVLERNWKNDLAFSIDILGEAVVSEKEAEFYFNQYLSLMECLAKASQTWPKNERLSCDSFGPLPSVNISVKASSLFSQIKTEAWEYSKRNLKNRLRPLFKKAVQDFVFVNLDMEQYQTKALFLEVF